MQILYLRFYRQNMKYHSPINLRSEYLLLSRAVKYGSERTDFKKYELY